MPSRIVEHEHDDARQARFGFSRESFEQSLEKFFRHPVGKIPEGFTGGWRCEGRDIEPVEPVMAMRNWTFADRCPDTARDGLQADAMLVRGKDSLPGCFAASSATASASFF